MAHTHLTLGPNDAGQRLDRFLRKLLPDTPRGVVFKWIRNRAVTVNGRRAQPHTVLQVGDVVKVPLATGERATEPQAAPVFLDVVFEDEALLAVNKPAGMLTHDDGGDEPNLADLVLQRLGHAGSHTFRPAPAHRLDRNTSGLVLVGKTAPAARALAAALREHRLRKRYLALVVGELPDRGEIDLALGREENVTGVGLAGSRAALTRYQVRERRPPFALLEIDLVTGRTHQIRAHLAHVGAPICGDRKYGAPLPRGAAETSLGAKVAKLRRPYLHAWRMELDHPINGEHLQLEAPLPAELSASIAP